MCLPFLRSRLGLFGMADIASQPPSGVQGLAPSCCGLTVGWGQVRNGEGRTWEPLLLVPSCGWLGAACLYVEVEQQEVLSFFPCPYYSWAYPRQKLAKLSSVHGGCTVGWLEEDAFLGLFPAHTGTLVWASSPGIRAWHCGWGAASR